MIALTAIWSFVRGPLMPWVVVLAVGAWALYERSDASDARAEKAAYRAEVAEAVAKNNAAVVEKLEHLATKADAAAERDIARDRAAKAETATTLSEIDRAPATADGPVAPVLRDALRGGVRGR